MISDLMKEKKVTYDVSLLNIYYLRRSDSGSVLFGSPPMRPRVSVVDPDQVESAISASICWIRIGINSKQMYLFLFPLKFQYAVQNT
jgi:hypothetical protein